VPRNITDHSEPDRFVAGTIGMPGDRTFYLQSRSGTEVLSVVLEKAQVALLSEKLAELLDEVGRGDEEVAAAEPPDQEDLDPLETPVDEMFRVGAFGIGWDTASRRVVIEIHAMGESEDVPDIGDDEAEGPDCLRVWLTPSDVRGFTRRSSALIAAGRPPCPFCHLPLDASGHICPRANGYRR